MDWNFKRMAKISTIGKHLLCTFFSVLLGVVLLRIFPNEIHEMFVFLGLARSHNCLGGAF